MVITLIEHLCGHEPGLTEELSSILEQLTKLNSSEHSRVALRARQVYINLYFLKKYVNMLKI